MLKADPKEAVESIYTIQNSVCAKDRPNTYIGHILCTR